MNALKKEKPDPILYEKYKKEHDLKVIEDTLSVKGDKAKRTFKIPFKITNLLKKISFPKIKVPKINLQKLDKKVVAMITSVVAACIIFVILFANWNTIKDVFHSRKIENHVVNNDENSNLINPVNSEKQVVDSKNDEETKQIKEKLNNVESEIDSIKDDVQSTEHYNKVLGNSMVAAKDGINGVNGIDGKNGVNGKNGAKGVSGANGKDGKDAISAYQIAVEAGYTGTEEEFAKVMAETPGKLKQYGIDLDNLNTTLDNNVLALNNSLQENVIKINGKIVENVESLNAELGITQDNIDELDNALQENNVQINGKIVDTAEALSTSLNTNVQTLNQTILDSFNTVNSTIAANYKEYTENNAKLNSNVLALNNSLQENVIKINGKIVENVESLNAALGITQDNIDELDNALQENNVQINGKIVDTAEALSTSLNTNVQTLNQTILDSFNTVNGTIASNYEEYTENNTIINNKISNLEKKLKEVFTSVSNGKAQVASAITDKGVATESDATFKKMHDNILTLATQQYQTGYADGLSAINNGTVTYNRHYHTGSSIIGGGCFTIPNYHRHVEGVCFYRCASHDKSMLDKVSSEHHSGKGDLTKYRCRYCGLEYSDYSGRDWAAIHMNGGEGTIVHPVYRCGKTTDTIDSYIPSCGYSEGQILSATVKY